MRILLVTIDFHDYIFAFERAVQSLDRSWRSYLGLRQYHLPTRIRRMARVTAPGVLGIKRDRNWVERRQLAEYLKGQNLESTLVLFVNGHPLATDEILAYIRSRGGLSALWLLDDLDLLPTVDLDIRSFDLLASYNRHDAEAISQEPGQACLYVPQGFDHLLNHGSRPSKDSILLVGSPGQRRQNLVRDIILEELDIELIGAYWPNVLAPAPHLEMNGADLPQSAVAAMTSNARVCLNVHSAPDTGINPRAFEVAAAGGVLVTDNQAITDLFDPGSEALLWGSSDQAIEVLRGITADRETARKIALNGQRRAWADHTLAHRFKFMLNEWDLFR